MEDEVPTINCSYVTEDSLDMSYMPFIKGGALYVRTKPLYNLGDSVQLIVRIWTLKKSTVQRGKVTCVSGCGTMMLDL